MYSRKVDLLSRKPAASSVMPDGVVKRYGVPHVKLQVLVRGAALSAKPEEAPSLGVVVPRKRKIAEVALPPLVGAKPHYELNIYDKFKQGDLVFGLARPQNIVRDKLKDDGFIHTYANSLNHPVIEMIVSGIKDWSKIGAFDASQLKHYDFLSKHHAYLIRKPGKTIPLKLDAPAIGAAYRRACKLLLINRAVSRTSYSHVIIDEIDWDRVVHKDKSKLGVTDSEMRAAYRDYRRHGRNPFILFYDKDLKLLKNPPWMEPEIKKHFDHYDDERAKKLGL